MKTLKQFMAEGEIKITQHNGEHVIKGGNQLSRRDHVHAMMTKDGWEHHGEGLYKKGSKRAYVAHYSTKSVVNYS